MDPKTNLQKITQEKFRITPKYRTVSETGQSHDKTFVVSADIEDIHLAAGIGKSKKEAEKQAAAKGMELLCQLFGNIYDVGVIGAGLGGVSAAVAAAREGASVVICDKLSAPGGLATYGLVNPFMTHCTQDGKPLVGGLFDEIKERLSRKNAIRRNCFDSEAMTEVLSEMLCDETNIEFLPDNSFVSVRKTIDGLFFVVLQSCIFVCRRIVDASGDGVCARSLGAEAELGDDAGKLQASTLMFDVAGVDIRSVLQYTIDNPDNFLFPKYPAGTEVPELMKGVYGIAGFYSMVKQAKEEKGYDFPGDILFFHYRKMQGSKYHVVNFNQTHTSICDPESEPEKLAAYAECERQMNQVLGLVKEYVPGFEKAYLLRKADMLGIRESYRIIGDYVFSDVDVAKAMKHRDRVCRLAYPVDIHSSSGEGYSKKENTKHSESARPPKGDWYEIPYRCLTAKGVSGLLVCGKIISATHEGMSATRIMPCVIATGQAAGAAAALSVKNCVSPDKLDYSILKPSLALL